MYRLPHREQHPPMQRPVDGCTARYVPAADGDVGATLDEPEQVRQHGRIVRPVDVHRDDDVVALVEGDGEALPVRRAEPALAGADDELDLPEVGRRGLDQLRSAIRAVVVDHQHVGSRNRVANGAEQAAHVVSLVVRRQDDHRAHDGAG